MQRSAAKMMTRSDKPRLKFYETWTFLILVCLVLPLVFRSLFFAPFHIPSGSMKSTLLIGDYIFVSKYAYGYSRFSFPLGIGFFDGRIFGKEPERGDVIVFRPEKRRHTDFIKRLIGMPGDRIQMRHGRLYINDEIVPQKRVENFVDHDLAGSQYEIKRYIETLPNGVSYSVLDEIEGGKWDDTGVYKVPEGHYFMMGDNRDNSADSRTEVVEMVPFENLVGRAELVFVSAEYPLWKFWHWFDGMRGERFWQTMGALSRPLEGEAR